MNEETIISTRPDRELRKKIITPGDYTVVPYEDSRCKIKVTEIDCSNESGNCEIEPESRIFSKTFDGIIVIGDVDNFLDRDIELILQQMCCGETCLASMVYRDNAGKVVKEIYCKIELLEVMEEQLISDWSWQRLLEASLHHKERGVELVKEKRLADAFRRFNKSLKMLVAIEPVNPELIDEDQMKQMTELKVKLLNNLAHLQLQFNEYEAALILCNRALKYDQDNVKALYRRCVSHSGLNLHEEAWKDIQRAHELDPNDIVVKLKVESLKPIIEKINKDYNSVIKKMFG